MGPAHRSRFRSRAAVIVTLAALPILWTPNVVVARKVVGGFRVAIPGALLTGGLPRAMSSCGTIASGCSGQPDLADPQGWRKTLAPLAGNRGFESTSLQRRVCKPSVPRNRHGKARISVVVERQCGLQQAHTLGVMTRSLPRSQNRSSWRSVAPAP